MIKKSLITSIILLILSGFLLNKLYARTYIHTTIREKFISYCIFVPDKEIKETPKDYGLKYEDVWIPMPGQDNLYGWFIPGKRYPDKYIIYLHGTKGNIGLYLGGIKKLYEVGANILILDYRGFGRSKGKELIKNTIEDSLAMYDYLINVKKAKPENINLFGYSYGGAMATELALKRKVHAILLESTFSSFFEIALSKHPPFVRFIVSEALLNSKENLKKLKIPVIIAYAEKDQIIPTINSKRLYNVANEPKYLYKIKNAMHHDIFKYVSNDYIELIRKVFMG